MSRALIKSTIDLRAALDFLELIEPNAETHSFCWFVQRHTDGRVRQFYGTIEDMLDTLIDFNAAGYSIFVLINAIDEPVYEDDKAKRRKQDITRVRAVFGDFDDPAVPLPAFALSPSILIETSPGKHHAYWLTGDMPLDDFEPRQAGIIDRYAANGSDKSIRDLSRVMRVPGFAHVKDPDRPKPVRIVSSPGTRYSAEALAAEFPHAAASYHKFDVTPWDGTIEPLALMTLKVVEANWPGRDGKHNVPCPREHLHSTTGGNASTYFAPSAANNGRGGYRCMHAHCVGLGVREFEQWIYDKVRGARNGSA